jgi:hypothetical protein
MSLSSFIERPEVAAKLKPLRPKLPRKIGVPLRVEPRSNRYSLVGIGFDYLLRFELQRRAPHAVTRAWVAEQVPEELFFRTPFGGGQGSVEGSRIDDAALAALDSERAYDPLGIAEEAARRARQLIDRAKAAVATYVRDKAPTRAAQEDVARHALRLARLEPVYRAGQVEPSLFDEPAPEDVQDLLDMLAVVPFNSLVHDRVLLLNPAFGESSRLVGGSDPDLITGDTLLDFKATKKSEMEVRDLDQMLGFFLLARNQLRLDPAFPQINRFALYFCRYGRLWAQDVTLWTNHPEFDGLEGWFFQHAGEVFRRL